MAATGGEEVMQRNEMQMIEVLMARLQNLGAKVNERKSACALDRNVDSDFCSSLVGGLQTDLSDDSGDEPDGAGTGRGKSRPSFFKPRTSSRDGSARPRHGSAGGHGRHSSSGGSARASRSSHGNSGAHTPLPGEVYVTFRSEPATDFGKRLEHKFEVEDLGKDRSGTPRDTGRGSPPPSAPGHGLTVTVDSTSQSQHAASSQASRPASRVGTRSRAEQKKTDARSAQRSLYEKQLMDNLESFVTRSCTDQHYTMPSAYRAAVGGKQGTRPFSAAALGGELPRYALDGHGFESPSTPEGAPAMAEATSPDGSNYPSPPGSPMVGEGADNGGHGNDEAEKWPIKVSAHELNPKLLLGLACARMTLKQGHKLFTRFSLAPKSCWLFVYMFWFCHCKAFQAQSEVEQEHLLRRIAAIYVQLLSSPELGANKDFFFKHYPYAVGNAISAGFYYLCPGSRHLYTTTFKRIVYLQCAQVLGGTTGVSPSSVLVARAQLYPEEAAEDAAAESKAAEEAEQNATAALELAREAAEARGVMPGAGGTDGKPSVKALGDSQAARARARLVGPARPGELSDDLPPLPGHAQTDDGPPGSSNGNQGKGTPPKPPSGQGTRRKKANNGRVNNGPSGDGGGGGDGAGSVASLDLTAESAESVHSGGHLDFGGEMDQHHDDGDALVAARRGVKGGNDANNSPGGFLEAIPGMEGSTNSSSSSSAGEDPLGEKYWQKRRAEALAPLQGFTGGRQSLRFRPPIPVNVVQQPLPRQVVGKFDAAGISPMLQQYLEHPEPQIKAGRKPAHVVRTAPVRWCRTGGEETSRPVVPSANLNHRRTIIAANEAVRKASAAEDAASRQRLRRELDALEKQRHAVMSGGAVSKGRYALDLVIEIGSRHSVGAQRRMEKQAKAEKAREDEEKERQVAAVEAQRKAAGIANKHPS